MLIHDQRMYRPSVDTNIKCYDPSSTGSQIKLKAALKKLFCDICETLISFQTRLEISGTVGITIDNESVMLLQFSEACLNTTDITRKSTPANRDDESPTTDSVSGSHRKAWVSISDSETADLDQKQESNLRRNSSSNNTIASENMAIENISKNGSGSHLANSSDSNDCLANFGQFDQCGIRANASKEMSNSKNETTREPNKISSSDVSEPRSARRNNSMLSQLLQRPPSNSEVIGNLLGHGNPVWAAPVSASEMLKKMSSRVDGLGQDSNLSENKSTNLIKSEPACFPSFPQVKTLGSSSPGSSYLRELLFQKATGPNNTRTNTHKTSSDRKRKRSKPEHDTFFIENDRDENGRDLDTFNSQLQSFSNVNSLENNLPAQLPGGLAPFFPEKQTSSSPCSNPEFSDYRYSMLLHKLVDVRRSHQLDPSLSDCNSFLASTLSPRVETGTRPFDTLSSSSLRFGNERDDANGSNNDIWPQEIKSELVDQDASDSPSGQQEEALVRFDTGSNHTTDNNHDSDAY